MTLAARADKQTGVAYAADALTALRFARRVARVDCARAAPVWHHARHGPGGVAPRENREPVGHPAPRPCPGVIRKLRLEERTISSPRATVPPGQGVERV